MKREEGFTLIELMAAITIIGVLMMVAIPLYRTANESARVSADTTNVYSLNAATELWEMEHGMSADEFLAVDHDMRMLKEHLIGRWIPGMPDDPWGRERTYSFDDGQWQPLGTP